jgi:predicted RNase H-like nuclease
MITAGVDGAPGGWVVVVDDAVTVEVFVRATFEGVRAVVDAAGAAVVTVDMPFGLAPDGVRTADSLARARLGARRSSLFPTPCRAVLDCETYAEALAVSRAVTGKGFSKQAWMLVPKIREVRAAIAPSETQRFREVHPETSFAVWAAAELASKHTFEGQLARFRMVEAHFAYTEDRLLARPQGCEAIDVFDAFACVWTARRYAAGTAEILGSGHDPDGYPLTLTV